MEHTHGRMTLKLTRNIDLCGLTTVARFDNIRKHQFSIGTGVLFHRALQEFCPFGSFTQLLIACLQHFQRFADQFSVLGYDTLQTFDGFGVFSFRHKHASHHDGYAGAVFICRRTFF